MLTVPSKGIVDAVTAVARVGKVLRAVCYACCVLS
jgi:hypothetical protein